MIKRLIKNYESNHAHEVINIISQLNSYHPGLFVLIVPEEMGPSLLEGQ